jgi:PiT family inorganic phosphate transporter
VLTAVVVIIFVALVFDFINGFHDAANSIATVVSTACLTPLQAVVWAAFFNFVAAFGFGVSVARRSARGSSTRRGRPVGHRGRAHRRDRVGPDHLVLGAADQLLACADRRLRRRGRGQGRVRLLIGSGLVKIGVFMILAPLIGLIVGFS